MNYMGTLDNRIIDHPSIPYLSQINWTRFTKGLGFLTDEKSQNKREMLPMMEESIGSRVLLQHYSHCILLLNLKGMYSIFITTSNICQGMLTITS